MGKKRITTFQRGRQSSPRDPKCVAWLYSIILARLFPLSEQLTRSEQRVKTLKQGGFSTRLKILLCLPNKARKTQAGQSSQQSGKRVKRIQARESSQHAPEKLCCQEQLPMRIKEWLPVHNRAFVGPFHRRTHLARSRAC